MHFNWNNTSFSNNRSIKSIRIESSYSKTLSSWRIEYRMQKKSWDLFDLSFIKKWSSFSFSYLCLHQLSPTAPVLNFTHNLIAQHPQTTLVLGIQILVFAQSILIHLSKSQNLLIAVNRAFVQRQLDVLSSIVSVLPLVDAVRMFTPLEMNVKLSRFCVSQMGYIALS